MESLLLVRHALARSNRDRTASCAVPGEGLTAEGVEQAQRLCELIATEEISLGVATELARTKETLDVALAGRDVARIVISELNEIDFGAFSGGLLADYRTWAAAHAPTEPAPGDGESRALAATRFARGLRLLLRRSESVVLHVGHALPLRYAIDSARGLVPAALITPVEHAVPFRLSAEEVEGAARLLEGWSRAPRFRDPSNEG